MMKRVILILVSVLVLGMFVGCGKTAPTETSVPTDKPTETPAKEPTPTLSAYDLMMLQSSIGVRVKGAVDYAQAQAIEQGKPHPDPVLSPQNTAISWFVMSDGTFKELDADTYSFFIEKMKEYIEDRGGMQGISIKVTLGWNQMGLTRKTEAIE